MADSNADSPAFLAQDRSSIFIGFGIFYIFIMLSCVPLRFYARSYAQLGWWWDDWLCLIGVVSELFVRLTYHVHHYHSNIQYQRIALCACLSYHRHCLVALRLRSSRRARLATSLYAVFILSLCAPSLLQYWPGLLQTFLPGLLHSRVPCSKMDAAYQLCVSRAHYRMDDRDGMHYYLPLHAHRVGVESGTGEMHPLQRYALITILTEYLF